MNPSVLFLDDCPQRTRMFRRAFPFATTVATVADVVKWLSCQPYDWLFLDHDLGGMTYVSSDDTDCGMEVVRWIEANRPTIGRIVVHSHNGPAAVEMTKRLCAAGYDVVQRSFAWLKMDRGLCAGLFAAV